MNENRRVKDVAGYLKEVSKIKAEWTNSTLVFRGQENEEWPLASSAERRLKKSLPSQNRIPDRLFIEYHEDLLKKCKQKNYDQRERKQLDDLELLADLQHHGAATCIDFTRNALVALWFACEKSEKNGKVFVVNRAAEKTFSEIAHEIKKPISYILQFKARETNNDQEIGRPTPETLAVSPNKSTFWHWTPAHLNERITAQHSLFLFGLPSSEDLNSEEILIESGNKKLIRRELEELHDIHEESLFPDFVGFAHTQRYNAPYSTPDAKEYFRRGVEAGQRGQYSEAIEKFTKAIRLDPDDPEKYHLRGRAYLDRGDYDHAIQDLTNAISRDFKFADTYFLRGHAYLKKNKHEDAIKDFANAIRLQPDAFNYIMRSYAYYGKGKYCHAIQDATKAIQLKPDFAEAYYARGLAYFSKEKYDLTIINTTEAIQLKSDYAEAYGIRGLSYRRKDEYENAIHNFTKTIELNPEWENTYYFRGVTLLALERWQEAKLDLTTAKNMGLNIVSSFRREYNSVADFEQETGITLPEDIAAMLTESEN